MTNLITRTFDRFLESRGFIKESDLPISPSIIMSGELTASKKYSGLDLADEWLSNYSKERLERLSMVSSWVFSNIVAISTEVSMAKYSVKEREPDERLKDVINHPLEVVIETPTQIPLLDASFCYTFATMWYLMRGEAYWMLVKNQSETELLEMYPIPTPRITPVPDEENYIAYFAYQADFQEEPIPLPVEDILYWRFPDPFNYHRGMGKVQAYRMAMETDFLATQWNVDSFEKGLALQTLLGLDPKLSKVQYEAAKQEIIQELVEARKRFIIARSGKIDAQVFGMTKREAEYLSGREMSRREIDRIFGVPEGYWSEKANRANAEASRATFLERAVWPHLVSLGRAITAQVLRPIYGEGLVGEYEDIRPRNRELEMRERSQTWLTQTYNEVRQEQGFDDHPDQDVGQAPFTGATQAYLLKLKAALDKEMAQLQAGMMGGGGIPASPAVPASISGNGGSVTKTGLALGGPEHTALVAAAMARFELGLQEVGKWRRFAHRALKAGEELTGFNSAYLPPEAEEYVVDYLTKCTDEQQLSMLFEGDHLRRLMYKPVIEALKAITPPDPWKPKKKRSGPPLADGVSLVDYLAGDQNQAEMDQVWTEAMEELFGDDLPLLEAEVEEKTTYDGKETEL